MAMHSFGIVMYGPTPPVFMKEGDVSEVEIEGLGILSNPILNETE